MKNNFVQEYATAIVKHASDSYSIISYVLIVLAWFLPFEIIAKFQLTVFVAFLCIIYAGYATWKETVSSLPQEGQATISLKSQSLRPHAFLGDGMIDPKLALKVNVDVVNNTNNLIILNKPEIIRIDLGSEIFEAKPSSTQYFKNPNKISAISFPDKIPAGERELVTCEIVVILLERTPSTFAKSLQNLKNFEVDFQFEYEDMKSEKHTETIHVQDSYDSLREEIMSFWKEKKQFELICEATGIAK